MTLKQIKDLKISIHDYRLALKNNPIDRAYYRNCIKELKSFIHDIITMNNKLNKACCTHKYFEKKLDFSLAICDITYKNIGFKKAYVYNIVYAEFFKRKMYKQKDQFYIDNKYL